MRLVVIYFNANQAESFFWYMCVIINCVPRSRSRNAFSFMFSVWLCRNVSRALENQSVYVKCHAYPSLSTSLFSARAFWVNEKLPLRHHTFSVLHSCSLFRTAQKPPLLLAIFPCYYIHLWCLMVRCWAATLSAGYIYPPYWNCDRLLVRECLFCLMFFVPFRNCVYWFFCNNTSLNRAEPKLI